jgi:transcriptional regulator with XRE-family HTH domain
VQDVIKNNCLSVREALGWSRDRLAKASGVPMSAIYLLERLGWEGTPSDRRIVLALELAARERLAASSLVDRLSAARQAEEDHYLNAERALSIVGAPQNAADSVSQHPAKAGMIH